MRALRLLTLLVLPGLLVAGSLTAPATAPQAAAASSTTASAPAAKQGAGRLTGVITFDKNRKNPFRSRVVWRVWRHTSDGRKLVERRSWRAGSGFTKTSTNPCRRNDGWLPNGGYRPRLHANYWGSLIKGRAIYLGNKTCGDGTLRRDLFIHTEQGDRNRQCPDRKGDQVCRWEYPRFNDYRSYGCIKMSPRDMRQLFDAWRKHFALGYDDRVRVRVVA